MHYNSQGGPQHIQRPNFSNFITYWQIFTNILLTHSATY